jgi:hypothetical protein
MHPGVALTPDDTPDWDLPTVGPGLLLNVPAEGRWLQRPALHLEAAPGYRLRVVSGGQPLLWARIQDWWDWSVFLRGTVLPLRAPSAEDDGRVKSWRKRARDGTLPPALLLYVDILAKWLVLDGHDRLHAALLEGVEPPLLGLWPYVEEARPESAVREQGALLGAEIQLRAGATPTVIDRVNRMMLRNFSQRQRGTVTRAWPVAGGIEAWRVEVLAWRKGNTVPMDEDDWDWFVSSKR